MRPLAGLLVTLGLAGLGGALGLWLRVPAGGIIGALLLVGAVSVATGRIPELSPRIHRHARVLTGTVIGSGIGPHALQSMGDLWLPALLMAAWTLGAAMALGFWVHRRTGLDLPTALFSFAPGGLPEMVLVAQDLGADIRLVSLIGLLRVLTTVIAVPLVLGYLVLRR